MYRDYINKALLSQVCRNYLILIDKGRPSFKVLKGRSTENGSLLKNFCCWNQVPSIGKYTDLGAIIKERPTQPKSNIGSCIFRYIF